MRLLLAALLLTVTSQTPAPSPRAALQPFNDLIGSWRCTGKPSGTREEQQKNFWVETLAVEWQFKGKDAWLKLDFTKGKHFVGGELRPSAEPGRFDLTLQAVDKKSLAFTGTLTKRESAPVLTLERQDEGVTHRLVFTFLHSNRFLYRYETVAPGKALVKHQWSVGATKEGESFAAGDGKPECVVSGGLGTMAVTHQGKTYYVCCSGCRAEFNETPAKYVAEFEARKGKKK